MRLVGLIHGHIPEFSVTGTIGILVAFLAMACALAFAFDVVAATRRFWPRPRWCCCSSAFSRCQGSFLLRAIDAAQRNERDHGSILPWMRSRLMKRSFANP